MLSSLASKQTYPCTLGVPAEGELRLPFLPNLKFTSSQDPLADL